MGALLVKAIVVLSFLIVGAMVVGVFAITAMEIWRDPAGTLLPMAGGIILIGAILVVFSVLDNHS